jgi:hypothetical protein
VSGGDIIDPVQQESKVILSRSGAANLQSNVPFSLYATYSVGGVAQAGVQISGWCSAGFCRQKQAQATVKGTRLAKQSLDML